MKCVEMNVLPINRLSLYCITPNNAHKINNQQNNCNNSDLNLYHTYPVTNISFQANLIKAPSKLERFKGCLLGGAIGDAFGADIEFMSSKEIKDLYGEYGLTVKKYLKNNKNLNFTDDTQMTIFTADGLIKSAIKNGTKYKVDFGTVFNSYLDWLSTQYDKHINHGWISRISDLYQQKAPGNTCVSSLMLKEPGTINNKINNSKGNGGIMRVAPVGLVYHRNPNNAFNIASGCAALTHSNPDAYLSAGTFAAIIAYLVKNESIENAVLNSLRILKNKNHSEEIYLLLNNAKNLLKKIYLMLKLFNN